MTLRKRQKDSNTNNKKKAFSKKRLIVTVLISLVFILLIGLYIRNDEPKDMTYIEFCEQVDNYNVDTVKLYRSSGYITFKLKDDEKTTYKTEHPLTDDFKETLLLKGIDATTGTSSFDWVSLATIIYPILLFCFVFKFAGNVGMNDFDVEVQKDVKVTFKDVAGMDELKEDLLTIADFMKDKKYADSGARLPRGILLSGPPGNGKTFIAKAFAGETGVNFIALNASDLGSQFVGIGSSKIKKLFNKAKENAPCVIFIDEIDGVGATRSDGNSSSSKEFNTILTTLLSQMDGFKSTENVIVFAATNRADCLDPALLRPGRFDKQFVVNPPDKKTRKAMFELYLKDKMVSDDVSVEKLANLTFQMSSSTIESVVNEAVIKSVRKKHDFVAMEDFDDALIEIETKGHRKKKDDKETERMIRNKKITAYHEAGHTVAGVKLLEKEIAQVSILPTTSGVGGYTMFEEKEDLYMQTLSEIEGMIMELYGGRAAEYILVGKDLSKITIGSSNDVERLTNLVQRYIIASNGIDYAGYGQYAADFMLEATNKLLPQFWTKTVEFMENNWESVSAIAELLLDKETVTGEDVRMVVEKRR